MHDNSLAVHPERLMKGRLLVTGGAGFIGSHVVEAAHAQGFEVAVIDNLSSGQAAHVPAGVTLYERDIRDAEAVNRIFQEFSPTFVSHHAAQVSVSQSVHDPLLDADINILGSLNLLEASRKSGVERFVFASTGGAIYGEVPDSPATESFPEQPISPYALSKRTVERYLEYYRSMYGLESRVLRYANVYGPRQSPHGEAGVVAIFLSRFSSGAPVQVNAREVPGDEGCIRDYLYVGDAVRANLKALEPDALSLLNVGTGVPTSTRALATQLAALIDSQSSIEFGARRPGDIQRSVLSPELFIQTIGQPTSLEAGLSQTVNWFTQTQLSSRGAV